MPTQTKTERLAAVFTRAQRGFEAVQAAVRDERMQCLSDRRFYSIMGAQWEGALGDQFENKPKFEINKIHLSVIRVISEYRNNRITVDYVSKDGSDNDRDADACDGLYRADEQASGAQEAYDNCYEEGVGGGMGAFRYRAAYENEDDDDDTRQRIRIEPIFDADSTVFFDLQAKRQDKADAKQCWVLNSYTHDAFEEEFGEDPASWPKSISQSEFDWCTPDVVWVVEYYEIEQKSELIHFFRGIDEEAEDMQVPDYELEENPDKLETLLATGFREVRQKRIKRPKVHKYLMSGAGVLEDCGYIAGKCIPIVPFYGKRWYVDGVERCMGHVRLARDAQMLNNMLMSWLAEMAARFDIEKPILTPEQIMGHALMWAEDNVKRYPYLLINQMKDAAGQPMPAMPVAYTKVPNLPPAIGALMQIAAQALEDMLGNQQAGEEMKPNISGKAVELIQKRLDMQVFIYLDNFKKTIQRGGEIWLSMARDLLIEPGRKMKTISADGKSTGSIELLRPMIDKDTDEQYLENDLANAKFDVVADVGPSSSTRKAATVQALLGMISVMQDPETVNVLSSLAMLNMEGEGIGEATEYFRKKLVKMGVVRPSDEEAKAMEEERANQPPDPNAEFLKASSAKAMADADAAQAKIGLTHAQTIETLAGIESSRQADAIALAQALTPDAPQAPAGAQQPGQQQAAPMQQ